MARAQAQQGIGIFVVEIPLLRLCPIPLQLVLEHSPVEVLGEEIKNVFILYVGPAYAGSKWEGVLSLSDFDKGATTQCA